MTIFEFEEWLSAVGYPKAESIGLRIYEGKGDILESPPKRIRVFSSGNLALRIEILLDHKGEPKDNKIKASIENHRIPRMEFGSRYEKRSIEDPREAFGSFLSASLPMKLLKWGGHAFKPSAAIHFNGPELTTSVRFGYYRNSPSPAIARKLSIKVTSGFGEFETFETDNPDAVGLLFGLIENDDFPEGGFIDLMAELSPGVMKAMLDLAELEAFYHSRPTITPPW